MPISFDRSVCCDLNETISREWLITNGRGGYAAGTVSGVLTRMQHGLLASPLPGSATPQLLLAKIDEEAIFDQRTYYLGTNEYQDGTISPNGFVHLETFRLEEGFPIFTYRIGGIDGILLEKRIWMPEGQNTTCIQYRVLRASTSEPTYGSTHWNTATGHFNGYLEAAQSQRVLTLTLLPFSAYRPHEHPQHGNNDWHFQIQTHSSEQESREEQRQVGLLLPRGVAGCTLHAWKDAHPYHIIAVGHPDSQTTFIPTGVWYWHFLRRHEQAAGRPSVDDLYLPGVIRTKLWPSADATLTIIVTAEELPSQIPSLNQLNQSYKRSVENKRNFLRPQRYFGEGGETSSYLHLLPLSSSPDPYSGGEEYLRLLLQAADRYVTRRALPENEKQGSYFSFLKEPLSTSALLSNFYGTQDSTRDTLIALPGLTIVTGRYEEASDILRSYIPYFKQGMLPDRLPTQEHPLRESDYGSVDTTLWYFHALDHYLRATSDYELLNEVYPHLVESIDWYIRGTFNGISVDKKDGLLEAQAEGKALTWMNAIHNGHPVTPRSGKAVEVNALWFNALTLMQEWSQRHNYRGRTRQRTAIYKEQSQRCEESFNQRFWYAEGKYLYDVIDGPAGNDRQLRPNQLLAFSLRYPVLYREYRQAVFDAVTHHLVTPLGLRTLAQHEHGYKGRLNQQADHEASALHQGSAWSWLIGPYIDAMLCLQESDSQTSFTIARSQEEKLHREFVWRTALQYLEPFWKRLNEGFLGMVGSIFDGDLPQKESRGSNHALVISVGELLRIYTLLARLNVSNQYSVLSA